MRTVIARGIDISWCQTQVDWSKVVTDFAIIQAGGGRVKRRKDDMFESHYNGAKSKGIPVGAYWFCRALTEREAIEEADIFISILAGKQFEYPVYVDVELNSQFNLGKSKLSAIVRAFLSRVESKGYWVGLYISRGHLQSYIEDDIKKRYALWLAEWSNRLRYDGDVGIWQQSETGKVIGITGNVDLDECYTDYPTKIKNKGLNGFSANTQSQPQTPQTTQLNNSTDNAVNFVPRLTIPERGNPYYNTIASGGYNPCIVGNPAQEGLNVYNNCVGHAVGRFNEIGGYGRCKYLGSTNAENFINQFANAQGLKVSQTPSLGACLVFAKGQVGNSADGAGHVAIVEKINADGSIVTSESGYKSSRSFWTTTRRNDGNWGGGQNYKFLGFIENPAVVKRPSVVSPYHTPTTVIKKGDNGESVKWLQWYLRQLGYFTGDIDGDFGKITLGALLAFQLERGLQVDGVAGSATQTALINSL